MQSTYENFKYRYDRQLVNPYDRGIAENFKEVFCTSIPPSKNNFRAKVPKELSDSYQGVGARSLSPMLKKPTGNVELGGVPVYNEPHEVESDPRNGFTNVELRKDSELANMSQHLSMILRTQSGEGQETSYIGHSPWQRTSRKWDITPEVLDRVPGVGGSNWTASGSGSGNSTKTAP